MDAGRFAAEAVSAAAPRAALMRRLDEASATRIVFIEAPAGFGKTVSARLWLAGRNVNARWLSLDAYDDAPAPFYQQLCAAVASAEEDGPGAAASAAPADPAAFAASPIEHAMMLARTLPEEGPATTFVLDDFHCIANRDLVQSLPAFIRRLPRRLRFLVLSRSAMPTPFLDKQVQDEGVACVRADELLFTAAEIRSFFAVRGRELADGQAEALREATGGWAFAVAAIAAGDMVADGGRTDEASIAPFLTAHVWSALDEPTRDMLVRASVVSDFTPPLFALLTGCDDAQAAIDDLMRRGLFLSRIGVAREGEGARYRFHAVFLDYLRRRAELAHVDAKGLSRTAARYYHGVGDAYTARRYAVQGGDMRLLKAQILEELQYGTSRNNRSIAAYVDDFHRSLANLPADALERYPFLYISLVWYRYLTGDRPGTEAALDALHARLPKIALRYPRFFQAAVTVELIDPRTSLASLAVRLEKLPKLPFRRTGQQMASITINLPFAHRCLRDFSEFVLMPSFERLERTVGAVFSEYFAAALAACEAGFALERAEFARADELALRAYRTYLGPSSSEEALFVVASLQMSAAFASGDDEGVAREAANIEQLMAMREAQFLEPNYLALRTDQALRSGDAAAAETWLSHYFVRDEGTLMLFRMVTYLTTVRAYVALGRNEAAADLAARVAELARSFARTIDEAEACTLGAIAQYRAGAMEASDALIDRAVELLEPYGFVATLAMEGTAAAPLVKRAKARWLRKAGDADSASAEDERVRYLNRVSIALQEQASRRSGLPGDVPAKLKLSKQQARMLELLARGCTNAEIVQITGLSLSTVKTHTANAYRKLNAHTAEEAVLEARRRGLIG
ncbi:LuxR C-terminal-related transcriptional regulator [Arabiibacter massiliensis]|uniref:LuxR C-terminal-related transcriptional regulator n=1 Tax=Arabiibacter massiliensis TaxID=1870985 RepID=UPI0009BC3C24|nr:LuxR C-terminal-related transcriptional regulator [Arabiibacter massiliensis]